MGAPKASAPTPDIASPGSAGNVDYSVIPNAVFPLWPANASVDVNIYVASSNIFPGLARYPRENLIVSEKEFSLDSSKKDSRNIHTTFDVPTGVQDNGTLFAHIYVAQSGAEMDPASPRYNSAKAYAVLRPLTQYLGKKRVKKTRNLLGAQNETATAELTEEEEPKGPAIASYYHPNVSLAFVHDTGKTQWTSMHPALRMSYTLEPTGARDETGQNGFYYPVTYLNTFWQLKTHMTELNATHPIRQLPININLATLPNWQFSIMATMDEGMKETARKAAHGQSIAGGGDGSELELIKETLLDTNPWLLGTTAIVSVLHMIFELLAFKSDVGHWRKKKDNVGVSVRTILSNVVMQTIIFLYLLDNNDNTSWMILFGQGTGIAIEAWKVTKTVDVRIREPAPNSYAHKLGLPRTIVFEDKHKLSDTEEKTEEYDRIAFKYMGILAVPLLLAYAAYSLTYETHKSWYSFIITTLVGSVYAYGFLMMVPSLYINYRLKSVAHMPARAMMYKFLNTFIDDLFAFTIKMPFLHRLATLRDDVIFFVYLYQAWAYKIDYTRVNEFGQGGDDDEDEDEDKKEDVPTKLAAKPLTSPADAKKTEPAVAAQLKDRADKAVSNAKEKGSVRKRKG